LSKIIDVHNEVLNFA
jgi:hypothetical protein